MPTLTEAIQTVINAIMEDVHTAIPGVISKYKYKTQEAEVQPIIRRLYRDNKTESIPVIARVPVMFPRTADAIIHLPISKGDTGLLIFSEAALEKWLSLGGETDPGDPRKFDLSDAIFIPGLYPFNSNSLADNNEDFIAQYRNTGLRIKKDGDIEVGGESFKKLIHEDIITAMNGHTHLYNPGPGTPIATATPIYTPPLSTTIHATKKVRAE